MILITGGTGLLGSHLLYALVNKGEKVRALRRAGADMTGLEKVFSYYRANDLVSKIEWVSGDILDVCSLEDAMKDVDTVYHCAALVSFDKKQASLMMKTNVEGTANVVNVCLDKKIKKLCYVSSVAALGEADEKKETDENSTWKSSPDNSDYAISKYSAEREVWRGIEEGLNAVIVNPSVIIGAGDINKSSLQMFRLAKKGIEFYSAGKTGFVDVRDVVKAMTQLTESNISNERFIISAENVSYKDFYSAAAKCFGNKPPYIKVSRLMCETSRVLSAAKAVVKGKRPSLTKDLVKIACAKANFSNNKIKDALKLEFIPLQDSVREVCEFVKNSVQ